MPFSSTNSLSLSYAHAGDRFSAISPHRGSISCLVHVCCLHVTLTNSRMNDLFEGFSIVRDGWHQYGFVLADESGDLPLQTNLSSCCCISAHSKKTPGTSFRVEKLKRERKQVRRKKLQCRQKLETYCIVHTLSPVLLPFSVFDIFMQIWASWSGSMERINSSLCGLSVTQ